MTDEPDILAVKRAAPIISVLGHLGLLDSLRRQGLRLVGPCPVHHGDNPTAFVVDLERNRWHCYTRCRDGGDAIDLVRRLQNVGFRQALRILDSIAHIQLPETRTATQGRIAAFLPFTRQLQLQHDTPFLRRKGILPTTAAHFNVGAWDGGGWLADCVAVRLHDPGGQPLGYAARTLDPKRAARFGKWKFPPGLSKSSLLFGYHEVLQDLRRAIVVVECPWGVLRLAQLGLPAVALLGCHTSPAQRALLVHAQSLVLLLDGDHAGHLGAREILTALGQVVPTKVASLPDGRDPDDLTDQELREIVTTCGD